MTMIASVFLIAILEIKRLGNISYKIKKKEKDGIYVVGVNVVVDSG